MSVTTTLSRYGRLEGVPAWWFLRGTHQPSIHPPVQRQKTRNLQQGIERRHPARPTRAIFLTGKPNGNPRRGLFGNAYLPLATRGLVPHCRPSPPSRATLTPARIPHPSPRCIEAPLQSPQSMFCLSALRLYSLRAIGTDPLRDEVSVVGCAEQGKARQDLRLGCSTDYDLLFVRRVAGSRLLPQWSDHGGVGGSHKPQVLYMGR